MMNTNVWPEPPADRQSRKARVQKRKQTARKALEAIDTRTPSGKELPF